MSASIRKNISWLGFGNFIIKPIWLLFIVFACARFLGAEEYGILTAVLFMAAIVKTFADLGITRYSIREVARDRDRATQYISSLLPVRFLTGIISVVIIILIGMSLGYSAGKLWALFLAGVYMTILGLEEYLRAFFRAFERMKYEAVFIIIEKTLVVAVGAFFLYLAPTASSVLSGMVLGMLGAFLLTFLWSTRKWFQFRWSEFSSAFIRQMLPLAIPLGLASQFVVIYLRTDAIMVDAMVGEGAAGQYGLAYRLIEASMMVTFMVTTVLYPRFSILFNNRDVSAFGGLFKKSSSMLAGFGMLLTGAFIFLAEPLVGLTNSPDFQPAVEALKILALVIPFMSVNALLGITISAIDRQNFLAVVLGTAAVANILLNFALIPQWGILGACYATLATEGVITVALGIGYARYRPSKKP